MDHLFRIEDIIDVCKYKLKLIIFFPISLALIGFFVSMYIISPVYVVQTDLLINQTVESNENAPAVTDVEMSLKLIDTYQFIMNSTRVHERVRDKLPEKISIKELAKKVKIETKGETQIISLLVEDSNLKNAENLANTYASTAQKEIENLMQMDNIQILSKPNNDENVTPVRPHPILYTVITYFIGLLIIIIYLCISLYFYPKIYRSSEKVKKLGHINKLFLKRKIKQGRAHLKDGYNQLFQQLQNNHMAMEAFRTIRTNILFLQGKPLTSMMVTSIGHNRLQEKTTKSLGVMMAMNHKKTLIIQANNQNTIRIQNDKENVGLTDYLYGWTDKHTCISKTSIPYLHVIHFGSASVVPAELFMTNGMNELLEHVKSMYDIILIDGPPMLQSNATVLASKVDGTILLGQLGKTKSLLLKQVKEQLAHVRARILGTIWIDPKGKRTQIRPMQHSNRQKK